MGGIIQSISPHRQSLLFNFGYREILDSHIDYYYLQRFPEKSQQWYDYSLQKGNQLYRSRGELDFGFYTETSNNWTQKDGIGREDRAKAGWQSYAESITLRDVKGTIDILSKQGHGKSYNQNLLWDRYSPDDRKAIFEQRMQYLYALYLVDTMPLQFDIKYESIGPLLIEALKKYHSVYKDNLEQYNPSDNHKSS